MKKFCLLLCLLLTGCAPQNSTVTTQPTIPATTQETAAITQPPETIPPDPIQEMLNTMSLEQRVGQLFLARCDDSVALKHIQTLHLGGFVLFGRDFQNQTPDSLRSKLQSYQDSAWIPLLIAVDEEGGTVTRVSSNPAFRERKFASPRNLYDGGGMEWVL